jgi:putative DNA primase/helicase
MCRRSILINLDLKDENAFNKQYSRNIELHVLQNREKLVSAALTVLQSFLIAKPNIEMLSFNGFIGWSNLVRSALVWLGKPDPLQSQAEMYEMDESRLNLALLLEAWHNEFQEKPQLTKDVVAWALKDEGGELKSIITELSRDKYGFITSKQLGYFLRSHARVRVGDRRFVKDTVRTDRLGIYWKIEDLSTPQATQQLLPEASTEVIDEVMPEVIDEVMPEVIDEAEMTF